MFSIYLSPGKAMPNSLPSELRSPTVGSSFCPDPVTSENYSHLNVY